MEDEPSWLLVDFPPSENHMIMENFNSFYDLGVKCVIPRPRKLQEMYIYDSFCIPQVLLFAQSFYIFLVFYLSLPE